MCQRETRGRGKKKERRRDKEGAAKKAQEEWDVQRFEESYLRNISAITEGSEGT